MTDATPLSMLSLFVAACLCAGATHADMMADSPVPFPERGALPSQYPPDRSGGKNQATENGTEQSDDRIILALRIKS